VSIRTSLSGRVLAFGAALAGTLALGACGVFGGDESKEPRISGSDTSESAPPSFRSNDDDRGTTNPYDPSKPAVVAPLGDSFLGLVVGDEPRSVLVGRAVLETGGTIGDAAAAMYFTMAVTYPAAASLGSGGVCIAYDVGTGASETIDFIPQRPAAGGSVAIPGSPRGFALVQSRYGRLDWETILEPAERYAAQGFPVTRAYGKRLAVSQDAVRRSVAMRQLYLKDIGAPYREGEVWSQPALAATLGIIRARGIASLYQGDIGREILEAAQSAGGAFTAEELRNFRAEIRPTFSHSVGGQTLIGPARVTPPGAFLSGIAPKLSAGSTAADLRRAARTTLQELGASGRLPLDAGSASFAVIDGSGDAIACAVTMNGGFGAARAAPGQGFAFARLSEPGETNYAQHLILPLIVTDRSSGREQLKLAGGGSGAVEGAAGVLAVALSAGVRGEQLEAALRDASGGTLNPVNAAACPGGLPAAPKSCVIGADPQADGLGLEALEARSEGRIRLWPFE